jgi:hypothetical protein
MTYRGADINGNKFFVAYPIPEMIAIVKAAPWKDCSMATVYIEDFKELAVHNSHRGVILVPQEPRR